MKLYRWISLLLVVLVALSALSGCASGKKMEDEMGVVDTIVPGDDSDSDPDHTQDPDDSKEPTDTKDPDDSKEPTDTKEPDDSKDPDDSKEPTDTKDPEDNKDPEDTKDPEDNKEPEGNEGEDSDQPKPVEKENSGTPVTILVQNLKHSGQSLGEKGDGTGNNIYNRIRRFKNMVTTHDPDVILSQEARIGWLKAFQDNLLFANTYSLHYRERGPEGVPGGDECTPVLWKTKKYSVEEKGFFWLSRSPGNPSTFYDEADAGYGRIVSWARLKDKATNVVFTVYSNHFGFGDSNQYKAQEQICNTFDQLKAGSYAFIGGDWNIAYRGATYNNMMEWDKMLDLRDVAMNMKAHGLTELGGMYGSGTGGRFDTNEPDPTPGNKHQIDYLMAKPNPHMAVDYYGFDYTHYDYPVDNVQSGYVADHYGLVVKLRLDTEADYSQYQKEHDYGENPIYWR